MEYRVRYISLAMSLPLDKGLGYLVETLFIIVILCTRKT